MIAFTQYMLKSNALATLINLVIGYASWISLCQQKRTLDYIAVLYLMVLTVTTAKKEAVEEMVNKVCILFRVVAVCPLSLGNSSKLFVD